MDTNEAAKASNALVAVVDFYAHAVGDLTRQLTEARAAVAHLTKHTKAQALEVEAQTERLKGLAAVVHALLLCPLPTPELMDELRKVYEQSIGPVELPVPPATGRAPRKSATKRGK